MSYGIDPAPNGNRASYDDPNQFGLTSLIPGIAPPPCARLGEVIKRLFQYYAQSSRYASQSELW